MRIDSLTSSASNQLILKGAPLIREGGQTQQAGQKTLGETPPIPLSLKQIGDLASMFAPTGVIGRLKKRLNYLKNKKCKVIPAKGTVACVDDEDTVYLGIEFLEQFKDDPETLAGVLAHEWGHACAVKPDKEGLQKLNWNEIFELRRAHETLADEICGRLLYLLGYSTKGITKFLTRGKETHNLKYHRPEIRARVVEYGFAAEQRKGQLARDMFGQSQYDNHYSSILLDIA